MIFVEFDTKSELYQTACELRNEILRKPIGLDLYSENLEYESDCRHFGVLRKNQLIGCLLTVPRSNGSVLLRQMCVEENYQRQGVGSFLMTAVEEVLKQSEVNRIELAARVSAVSFYEALGYACINEEYDSVGIPHRKMEKRL